MVDDKLRILAAMKDIWGDRLFTIFPRQGHYALDPMLVAAFPPADLTIERIADLPSAIASRVPRRARGSSGVRGAGRR